MSANGVCVLALCRPQPHARRGGALSSRGRQQEEKVEKLSSSASPRAAFGNPSVHVVHKTSLPVNLRECQRYVLRYSLLAMSPITSSLAGQKKTWTRRKEQRIRYDNGSLATEERTQRIPLRQRISGNGGKDATIRYDNGSLATEERTEHGEKESIKVSPRWGQRQTGT